MDVTFGLISRSDLSEKLISFSFLGHTMLYVTCSNPTLSLGLQKMAINPHRIRGIKYSNIPLNKGRNAMQIIRSNPPGKIKSIRRVFVVRNFHDES